MAVAYSQLAETKMSPKDDVHVLKLIDALSPKENDKVLDIGCGTGELTRIFTERVESGGKVVGVDPDKERVKIANEKYAQINLDFVEADSETFPEDQYDIVFSNYAFHWIRDKDAMFKKVSQNMCSGGKFGFIHVASNPQICIDLTCLMGPDKGKAILEKMSYFETIERYEMLGSSNGLVPVQKELYSREIEFPNLDVLFKFWRAITNGEFDPRAINEDALEKFRQQYGMGSFKVVVNLVSMIFTKP